MGISITFRSVGEFWGSMTSFDFGSCVACFQKLWKKGINIGAGYSEVEHPILGFLIASVGRTRRFIICELYPHLRQGKIYCEI